MMHRSILVLGTVAAVGCVGTVSHSESQEWQFETWGTPFHGLQISVRPRKAQYKLGETIQVFMALRNVTDKELVLRWDKQERPYRLALFSANGRPVAKTRDRTEKGVEIRQPVTRTSTVGMPLGPRQTLVVCDTSLHSWFRIDQEGVYFLVVMHTVNRWSRGFAISNLAKFRVTSRQNNDRSPAEPSKTEREKDY